MPPIYVPENQRADTGTYYFDYDEGRFADHMKQKGIALSANTTFNEQVSYDAIENIKQD